MLDNNDLKHSNDLFLIEPDASLQMALTKIEANKYGTLIVVDENRKVLGTLSDGDVRKSLLAQRSMLAPVYDVMNTHYQAVLQHDSTAAKLIFQKHFFIKIIPVVDNENYLQRIIFRDLEFAFPGES